MDYTLEDVKRDLRRLKVNDLYPATEEQLIELYRESWREKGITPSSEPKMDQL